MSKCTCHLNKNYTNQVLIIIAFIKWPLLVIKTVSYIISHCLIDTHIMQNPYLALNPENAVSSGK